MNETVRLGHIAGVRVGVNWSVLVIFVLITSGLAAGQLPLQFPGLPTGVYVLAGLAAALVFLASLLAHEVSHAIVAQRNGIEVDGITLWMLGGVARLSGEGEDPGTDLRISGVGPLVSLACGASFFVLALLAELLGAPGIVVGVVGWLALINVVLAVFNLVPAAPLDGGRILRALLWRRHGDRQRAALAATRAGRVFGFVIVGLGVVQIVALPGLAGLWPVLLGWFLVAAASAEEQQTRFRSALGDVPVREVMSPEPTTAPGGLTLDEFVDQYVLRHRYSAFPLTQDSGEPAGLVTLQRVKQVPRQEWATTRVLDIACGGDDLATAHPDEALTEVIDRMSRCSDGRVLVVEDGRVVGLVSPADITRRQEISELRPASAGGRH